MSKGTTIVVGDADVVGASDPPKKVCEALSEFTKLAGEVERKERELAVLGLMLRPYAETHFFKLFDAHGKKPETPFRITATTGASALYGFTDRSKGYEIKEEAGRELRTLLGNKAFDDITAEAIDLSFDRDVLREQAPGDAGLTVAEVLAIWLGSLKHQMRVDGVLTDEQADKLFKVESARRVKPDLVKRLPELARAARVSIKAIVDVLGSAFTRGIGP